MLQFKKTASANYHIWKKMKNMTQIIYKNESTSRKYLKLLKMS
jgi:hypothetical protein